jgi:LysR family transcriptional regulator, glycine cleavage system transcriptional activator
VSRSPVVEQMFEWLLAQGKEVDAGRGPAA